MATKIKKISELEQITELSSSSNVVIEENGKAKRIAASNLDGKVKTVNGVEPDENGNIEVQVGGGVTSWNDLTDRPFYEEGTGVTIEWDGSTEGRESFAFGSNTIFYKVSDATPSVEMLSEAKVTASVGEETFDYPLADAMVTGDGWIVLGELGLVITKVPAGNLDGNPVTASSVGVYINSYVSSVSITYGSTTVHQLDEKFIPDSVKVQADFSQNDPTKPDYVRNRTHWEEDNQTIIEWDGNTEGRDNFIVSGPNLIFYKVSDNTPTSEEIIGGFFTITDSEGSPEDINIIEDDVISGDKCIFLSTYIAIAYDTQINVFGQDITLTTTGTYFLYLDRECVSKLTYGSTTVHKLDEKFIPDFVKLPTVTTENNGAILQVVDGVWTAVNLTDVSVEGA